MSEAVTQKLVERFGDSVLHQHAQCGDETVVLDRAAIHEACLFLRDDEALQFDMPIDVTCVDYQGFPGREELPYEGRFEVVYHLYSLAKGHRIRLKVPLSENDLRVDSVVDVWKGVDWFERETWDMYGICFEGRGEVERLLMYDEFVGHPLRKDYPRRGYQPLMPMPRLNGEPTPASGAPEEDL